MKKIIIKGTEYPCRMTMGAMLRFKRETGREVSQISSDDLSDMVTLMWCCTASACNADKIGFALSLDDFADALEPGTVTAFFTDMVAEGDKKKEQQENPKG